VGDACGHGNEPSFVLSDSWELLQSLCYCQLVDGSDPRARQVGWDRDKGAPIAGMRICKRRRCTYQETVDLSATLYNLNPRDLGPNPHCYGEKPVTSGLRYGKAEIRIKVYLSTTSVERYPCSHQQIERSVADHRLCTFMWSSIETLLARSRCNCKLCLVQWRYPKAVRLRNLRGLSPRVHYTDRATAACRRS
jgi:hypothetical protein